MISRSHTFVYIHIPKCGGTSVIRKIKPFIIGNGTREGLMSSNVETHEGYADHSFFHETYQRLSKSELDTFYKFSIVRNIYDRLASFYGHQGHRITSHFRRNIKINNFTDFIMNIDYILEEIRVQNKHSIHNRINRSIEPVSDWLYIDGKNYFDDIFDLKNLDSEWKTISQKIGIPHTPLPKNNVRNKKQKSYNFVGCAILVLEIHVVRKRQ